MEKLLTDLGFGTETKTVNKPYTAQIDQKTGKLVIEIDLLALKDIQPNANGNKVLNVYEKFNQKLKFSGNVIFATADKK